MSGKRPPGTLGSSAESEEIDAGTSVSSAGTGAVVARERHQQARRLGQRSGEHRRAAARAWDSQVKGETDPTHQPRIAC